MKGLRERLVQPEQYLKTTLEDIGIINRSGPYVGKWMLKSEYKNRVGDGAPQAGEVSGAGGEGGGTAGEVIEIDDDDDLIEMEDVPL